MDVQPLKKELYNEAKELGVTSIHLDFSGGNDEGHLYAYTKHHSGLDVTEEQRLQIRKLEGALEEWAWEVYEYSGAGDGTDYGDNITYNLVEGKVTTQEWCHVEQLGEAYNDTLETR